MGKVIMSGIVPQLVAPVTGILASDLAVGSTVKLMENGSPVEYLVVHNGLPSSMYDASCDGLWLLRKDCHSERVWDSSNNDYANSDIHAWLNGDFLALFGEAEQGAVVQAKIPYRAGSETSTIITSGANGLSTKFFLLSSTELGFSGDFTVPSTEGTKLSYFASSPSSGSSDLRIAKFNGTANIWWCRTPYCGTSSPEQAMGVNASGNSYHHYTTQSKGIRPALILPKTAIFDEETLILKGVS